MQTIQLLTAVKAVSMPRVLAGLGVMPVRGAVADSPALYCAPYRDDHSPSMSVFCHNGEWLYKDHATGDYGTNIDIIIKMGICRTWRDAMQYIAQHYLVTGVDVNPAKTMSPVRDAEPSKAIPQPAPLIDISQYETVRDAEPSKAIPQTKRCVILSVEPIKGSPAAAYVTDIRRIPMDIASRYLSFIRYTFDGTKVLSGIGWPTVSGSWSVRWPVDLGHGKGKTFVGNGGPSVFQVREEKTGVCDVFEGMFDFLSFIAWMGRPQTNDAIVLNSVANVKAAIPMIHEYTITNAFMDNDEDGRKAMKTLLDNNVQTIDNSPTYSGYKDFNDFWKTIISQQNEVRRKKQDVPPCSIDYQSIL